MDTRKMKHQLFHLLISLCIVLISITYMQYNRNWARLGNFWHNLTIPIVFIGEMLKVLLCHYYAKQDTQSVYIVQSQNSQRSSSRSQLVYFTPRELAGGLTLQFICMLLFAFICIILGAPVLHNYEQTFVLALLLTLLSVSPTVFLIGAAGALQICFCEKPDIISKSEEITLELFKYNAIGGILGAWAGSIVAPLDWDRDWQNYPIPNIIGALFGSVLGNIFACSGLLQAAYITTKMKAKFNMNMNRKLTNIRH